MNLTFCIYYKVYTKVKLLIYKSGFLSSKIAQKEGTLVVLRVLWFWCYDIIHILDLFHSISSQALNLLLSSFKAYLNKSYNLKFCQS